MAITLKDIAQKAGVSVPTVSAILNQKTEGFAVKTIDHVRQVAQELGYRPNAYRHALITKRFNSVGMLYSGRSASAWLFPATQIALRRELDRFDQHLLVDTLPDETTEMPKMLREWCVDGMLVTPIDPPAEVLRPVLEQFSTPFVWMNQKLENDCVYPDDVHGGLQATEHLLELGHTRIAYVNLSTHRGHHPHYSIADRAAGYAGAMIDAGFTPRTVGPTRVIDKHEFQLSMRKLLEAPDRPTAIVTYGPNEACAAYAAAMRLGLRVPEDLSIVGINDLAIDTVGERITTSRIAAGALGWESIRMLMRKVESPHESQPAFPLKFKWEQGMSTAPPGQTTQP